MTRDSTSPSGARIVRNAVYNYAKDSQVLDAQTKVGISAEQLLAVNRCGAERP